MENLKRAGIVILVIISLVGIALETANAQIGAWDPEMEARIQRHQAERGEEWSLRECPLELGDLASEFSEGDTVLVDCLTLWLSNLLGAGRAPEKESERLVSVLANITGPVVLVSNEVGLGVVPENALARAFVDHAGRLHQAVGTVAQSVRLVAAGQALHLKSPEGGEAKP